MSFEENTDAPEISDEMAEQYRITLVKDKSKNNPVVKKLKGYLARARSDGPSEEDFQEMQDLVEGELDALPRALGLNVEQLNKWINLPTCSIQYVDNHNFSPVYKLVTEYHAYALEKHRAMTSYLSYWKIYEEFLTTYGAFLSDEKTLKGKSAETSLHLAGFYLKKKEVENMTARIEGLKEAYHEKSKTVSRLVSFWELELKINPERSVMKQPYQQQS